MFTDKETLECYVWFSQKLLIVASVLLCFQQVFFVESVCDDPEVIAANILVWTYVTFTTRQWGAIKPPTSSRHQVHR